MNLQEELEELKAAIEALENSCDIHLLVKRCDQLQRKLDKAEEVKEPLYTEKSKTHLNIPMLVDVSHVIGKLDSYGYLTPTPDTRYVYVSKPMLQEILTEIKAEVIVLEIATERTPLLIYPQNENTQYVLAPRIEDDDYE